jgi:galactokinase
MDKIIVSAPGRVNLIGEHTDYNDGFVLPIAIDRYIRISARKRDDDRMILYSKVFNQTYEGNIRKIEKSSLHWANYCLGVAFELQKQENNFFGVEAEIDGDIPIGAGLSSSAAIEVASLIMFLKLGGFNVEPVRGVKICQKAENEFVGMKCGIMDQFVSAFGKKGCALFLDCRSLAYKHIQIPNDFCFAVIDSKIKRQLVNSEYNRRRQDCEQGVYILQSAGLKIRSLRDVNFNRLLHYKKNFPEDTYLRCEHVVKEIERTILAEELLRKADMMGFGNLMYESHMSLRNLYEVSCNEIDVLVDITKQFQGVYGSRMTGAGFGGCTVTLIKRERFDSFAQYIKEGYLKRANINCDVYRFEPSEGAYGI